MKQPSNRMQNLPGNFFAELESRIAALQASGCDVIRLDIGSPDLPPAPFILEAMQASSRLPESHGYQTHAGPPELRQAWANMYRRVYGVELDPKTEIVPLLGSKEGIFHLTQAWIDPGDVVLVPDPGYMTYARAAAFSGGEIYLVPLLPEHGYLPDFGTIPAGVLRRAKMLWLNYPNNPTAAVASLDFFAEAVAFAHKNDLLLCHDAAYTQVAFDGKHTPSILEVPRAKDVAIEMNSLSKSHNLAGWRVGACVGSPAPLSALFRLKTNLDSGHFLPISMGAIAAMNGDQGWLSERNDVYRQRRDILLQALHAMSLPVETPQASIYIWCPVPDGWSSLEFTNLLLETIHLSVTPGTVFGSRGEGFIRLSLGIATDRISEAAGRILAVSDRIERRSI